MSDPNPFAGNLIPAHLIPDDFNDVLVVQIYQRTERRDGFDQVVEKGQIVVYSDGRREERVTWRAPDPPQVATFYDREGREIHSVQAKTIGMEEEKR